MLPQAHASSPFEDGDTKDCSIATVLERKVVAGCAIFLSVLYMSEGKHETDSARLRHLRVANARN